MSDTETCHTVPEQRNSGEYLSCAFVEVPSVGPLFLPLSLLIPVV